MARKQAIALLNQNFDDNARREMFDKILFGPESCTNNVEVHHKPAFK
jgi:hypothetical protein